MSEKPPYRLVADKIREKILAGAYRDGKIPSERALMRHHAISRATATKALDALVDDGLVVRRRGAGAFVNAAGGPQRTTLVSTLFAEMDVREFFSTICNSIADRARAYNLSLVWGTRREFEELTGGGSIAAYIARCRSIGVRGVFFVPRDSPPDSDPADAGFVRSVARARPDGIAFVHDDMAIGFMPAWERVSRRKVRYVGIDDISHCAHLGISSMRQPARFIGEEAARLMALRLGSDTLPPRQVLFSAELVARRSSVFQ